MSKALPPDVEAELRAEFSRGVNGLRSGRPMRIGGLVLCRNMRERRFIISCFAWQRYVENIRRSDAEARIATAKEELGTLVSLFPELRNEMYGLDLSFEFCYDDGKLSVCLAKDEQGRIQYFGQV